MAARIWETPEWAALKAHAEGEIAKSHLRDLMKVRTDGGTGAAHCSRNKSARSSYSSLWLGKHTARLHL